MKTAIASTSKKMKRNEFTNAKAIRPANIIEVTKDVFNGSKPWYNKSVISLFTTLLLTSADFYNLKSIFEKTISGSGILLAVVSAYILNFIAILAVHSIEDYQFGFGTKTSNLVAIGTSFLTFSGLFALTAYLRWASRDITFSSGASIISSTIKPSQTTVDPNSPKAIALSLFLMVFPLITTLVNGLLAWISYDPVALRLYRIEKTRAKLVTSIEETEQAILQLQDDTFISNLEELNEANYASAREALEQDRASFVCELNEEIMKTINASAEDIDILSHRIKNIA